MQLADRTLSKINSGQTLPRIAFYSLHTGLPVKNHRTAQLLR